jgi:uncharacterized cupin superfamily protein
MNHPDARLLESASFRRSMAGPDILSQIAGGEVWICNSLELRHHYDWGITLYVYYGWAAVDFADGSQADLRPGDTMTITQGASAVWATSEAIRNSYIHHDAA